MSVPAQVPISGPYIANGVTTQFAYKFYLLFATDMQVFVGGQKKTLNTDYTVTGVGNSQGGNVVFTTAPASGLEVLIKRATPYTRQTDYADNGDLLADVVNDDFDRIWLALQEINASFSSSISKPVGGNWDAQGLRLTGLADGSQPQDAVTYNQLFTVNGSAGQSATAAADSATAAKNSENNAVTSQQAAAGSAGAASVSAGNSSDSASLAQKWAANPVGTEVTAGKYSAFHYASKASDSATAAATSATNAATSATNASNSAAAASQSATSAKSDADRAQSANPDNQLKKANNLSDVADKPTAWKNIAQFGTTAGTAAQGNDTRLGTIDQKTGGAVSGDLSAESTALGVGGHIWANGNFQANNYRWGGMLVSQAPAAWGNSAAGGRVRTEMYVRDQINVVSDFVISSFLFGARRDFGVDTNGNMFGPLGTIQQNGSDIRLKNEVVPSKFGASARIRSLGSVEFTWIDSGKRERGWIAQQAEIVDELYVELGGKQGDRDFQILNIKDRAILADVVTCLSEIMERQDKLESRIASLESARAQ